MSNPLFGRRGVFRAASNGGDLMKYATSAALSLALSLGLAAAAQAQGVQPTNPSTLPPAASQTQGETQGMQPGSAAEATSPTQGETQGMKPGTAAEASPAAEQMSPSTIKGAQRALRAQGLYHGKVDGVVGPETHQAIAQFQQRNNLEPTGELSADTVARLTGTGVGSTMPNAGAQPETAAPGQPMPGTAAEPTSPAPGGNEAPTAPGAPPAR